MDCDEAFVVKKISLFRFILVSRCEVEVFLFLRLVDLVWFWFGGFNFE